MVVEAQCDVDVVGGVNRQISSLVSFGVVLVGVEMSIYYVHYL